MDDQYFRLTVAPSEITKRLAGKPVVGTGGAFCGRMLQVKVQIGVISAVIEGPPSPQRIMHRGPGWGCWGYRPSPPLVSWSWDFYLIISRIILQHMTVTLLLSFFSILFHITMRSFYLLIFETLYRFLLVNVVTCEYSSRVFWQYNGLRSLCLDTLVFLSVCLL